MQVVLDLKNAKYYFDDIARKQLPYACAKTLTAVSAKVGEDIAARAGRSFHTTTLYSHSHKTARLGASPSSVKSSSFVTLPADKRHGLMNMKATLLNQHWGISQQVASSPSVRTPAKSKFLWAPVQTRRRHFSPGKALRGKNVFVIKSQDRPLIVKRKGKTRALTPLFAGRKTQTINPVFDFRRVAADRAQRYMNVIFEREITAALRTAR